MTDPMPFITLACGHELNLSSPSLAAPSAATIAHSLAQINRFTGHCVRPYSVAEHSLLVVEICERELGLTASSLHQVQGLFAALMHDAHECITGDQHTPGKRLLGPVWQAWEGHWERHLRRGFGMHVAAWEHRDTIKQADLIALATERRDLLPDTPTQWPAIVHVQPLSWVNLNSPEREALTWRDWRELWLARYDELDYARQYFAGFRLDADASEEGRACA